MVDHTASNPANTRATLLLRLKSNAPVREIAWREFHDLYSPIILGFARKMGARSQDISDVLQDVLVGFFAVAPEFVYDPAKGRFRGYLKTCTWRMFQKRLGNQVHFGGRSVEHIDPDELQVEATWNDIWEREKLQRALNVVRDRYLAQPTKARTFRAFEMYVLLERDADAVARELGMSIDSVHQAKARVSHALRVEANASDESNG
jgi:RNA polymerase sigma factor (sigma-70 family)